MITGVATYPSTKLVLGMCSTRRHCIITVQIFPSESTDERVFCSSRKLNFQFIFGSASPVTGRFRITPSRSCQDTVADPCPRHQWTQIDQIDSSRRRITATDEAALLLGHKLMFDKKKDVRSLLSAWIFPWMENGITVLPKSEVILQVIWFKKRFPGQFLRLSKSSMLKMRVCVA